MSTYGVYLLVAVAVRRLGQRVGNDVTLDVVGLINATPAYLRRYHSLCARLGRHTVNNWIARHTKHLTGRQTGIVVTAPAGALVLSYTQLLP